MHEPMPPWCLRRPSRTDRWNPDRPRRRASTALECVRAIAPRRGLPVLARLPRRTESDRPRWANSPLDHTAVKVHNQAPLMGPTSSAMATTPEHRLRERKTAAAPSLPPRVLRGWDTAAAMP
jgi:hypothetical protein